MLKPKRVAAMRSCADSILQKDEMAQVDDVRIADTASRAGTRGGGYQGDSETVGLGQVQLVPILSFIDGVWSVEFKIGSTSNGSSYVLKSIPQFVLTMANGDYTDYGQKLAFTPYAGYVRR